MAFVCLDCTSMFGTRKTKSGFGIWTSTCSICGKEKPGAESQYDFGISDDQIVRIRAFMKDMRDESTERGWDMV